VTEHYNLESIRTLLIEGFDEEELRTLCFDKPILKHVYENWSTSSGKSELARRIVDYADKKLAVETVLSWAKIHNPHRYEMHQPYTFPHTPPQPLPSVSPQPKRKPLPWAHIVIPETGEVVSGWLLSALRDPVWQGIAGLVAILALIVALRQIGVPALLWPTPTSTSTPTPTLTPTAAKATPSNGPTFTPTPCSGDLTSCLQQQGDGCPDNMKPTGKGAGDEFCEDTFVLTSPVLACGIHITMTARKEPDYRYGYSLWEVEAYGPGTDENLLNGGTVVVSSTDDDRFACYVIGGDMATRWDSKHQEDPQWLEITLVEPAQVDRIVLKWEKAYAAEYCVSIIEVE